MSNEKVTEPVKVTSSLKTKLDVHCPKNLRYSDFIEGLVDEKFPEGSS